MVLTDQQLRQELINYGEIVPTITQRNREQLRARLEVLRSQKQTRAAAGSPSRLHATASPPRTRAAGSPSGSHATASPSRTRAAASPSRSHGTKSPPRTRATASPSRVSASPSRSRAAATSPSRTGGSGRTTRSKQTPNLIELSDSETEPSSNRVLMSRSVRAGQTAPHAQTRSIPLRSQHDSPTSLGSSGNMTDDVEQSIARHRREIKQLLDSARNRDRPPSPTSKSRTRQDSSKSDDDTKSKRLLKSDDDTKSKRSSKSDNEGRKKGSVFKSIGKPFQSFWKKYMNFLKNFLKIALISSILLGGFFFLMQNMDNLLPRREPISCSVKNATECEDMKPVIAAVRKQLQIRTGEVDCGFRPKTEILVKRAEIEKYLNEKGLKFNLGDEERWNALLTYIFNKPINDILVWNEANQQTKNPVEARKLSTTEATRSLSCHARQDVSKTIRNLILLILGSTGLLTLAWFLQRKSKEHEENEKTFKDHFEKAKKLIEQQYEKHVKDPQAQPWLAINHIRDKLIPKEDQERLKNIWERVKNEISKQDSRIRSELQEIDGKKSDVWRWIKSATSSPKKTKSIEETDDHPSTEVGLTECLKLRNCFRSEDYADDDEIDHVVDSIQNRCANIKRIEHIGIHSVFVYLKFSSKKAAAQGYHLLNNWNYQDRDINVKYVRPNRYHEHFPEARDANTDN